MSQKANRWVRQIRDDRLRGGSHEHAAGVQWFFKEKIRSHGWYTADLRRFAHKTSRDILELDGPQLLLRVADRLFSGDVLEEKVFAVLLLENQVAGFGDREFKLFDSWLDQ